MSNMIHLVKCGPFIANSFTEAATGVQEKLSSSGKNGIGNMRTNGDGIKWAKSSGVWREKQSTTRAYSDYL